MKKFAPLMWILFLSICIGSYGPRSAQACMCDFADNAEKQERVMKLFDLITTIEVL